VAAFAFLVFACFFGSERLSAELRLFLALRGWLASNRFLSLFLDLGADRLLELRRFLFFSTTYSTTLSAELFVLFFFAGVELSWDSEEDPDGLRCFFALALICLVGGVLA
jgi:hypothetical protein